MKETAGATALVLSGGGARGAYEAGVLAGLRDVLGPRSASLFDVFTGTSVGAINATHLAAHADDAEKGVSELVELWTSLQLRKHLRPRPLALALESGDRGSSTWGRALLDARPFEALVQREIPWDRLHANVRSGLVHALIVSALEISAGKTNTFVELAPTARVVPSPHDPRRVTRIESITAEHVLASAALPLLFPARRVHGAYYCDGGLRFNTPIAPAIRAGATKLVVVPLRATPSPSIESESGEPFPPVFMLGKILDALLHDPIDYDLQVLERFNRILEVMATTVPRATRQRIAKVVEAERGVPYRRVRTLVFRPSENIGVLALVHLRKHGTGNAGFAAKLLLEKAASLGTHAEADFLSFVLFDGKFAETLVELGRRDVRDRATEVEDFFAS